MRSLYSSSRRLASASLMCRALSLVVGLLACSDSTDPDFDPTEITVRVKIAGNGGGRVTAPDPVGINCGKAVGYSGLGDCSNTFVDAGAGGSFTLDAVADSISTLAGWSGDCTGVICRLSFPSGRDTVFDVTATINLNPPVARIDLPLDGSSFHANERIQFQGSVTDAAGRVGIVNVSAEWESSLEGVLCSGPLGCPSFGRVLAVGTHTITLKATDAAGTTASTSISIIVRSDSLDLPPTARINSPDDGTVHASGNGMTFSGDGLDPEESSLSGNKLVWRSNRDGFIGTGGFLIRTLPSAGTHVISLAVTDSKGQSDTAHVMITLSTPGAPATIRGTVTIANSPVAGATVDLSGAARITTATDSAGRYDFVLLPDGNYTIILSGVPQDVFATTLRTLTLGLGETATVDFTGVPDANPSASISGRVTGNGYGIGGATLTLTGPVSATMSSGNNGEYSFTGLPAGTYTVSVSTPLNVSFPANPQTVTLASGQALIVDFAGTY